MRKEKLNFGVIIRVIVSLIPILFGMPTLAIISCSYNLAMSFIVFGPLTAFVSSLFSICVAMFFGGSYGEAAELTGLVWAIQSILCCIGCIYGILYKKKFSMGLSYATLGIMLPQFFYIQHSAHSDGMTIAEALIPSLEDVKLSSAEIFAQIQQSADASVIEQISSVIHEITTMLIPSILIISSMIPAYIVLWAILFQMRKLPHGVKHSFSHIKVSRMTSIFTVISLVLSVAGFVSENKILMVAALNTMVVLSTMCFFSGISLVDFYARRFLPLTFLRVIIYVMLSLNLTVILILLALIDSFADFRKLSKIYEKSGEPHETEEGNA